MVTATVKRVGRKLERLVERRIPLPQALSLLERKAGTVEELVVIEVMREVNRELPVRPGFYAFTDSSARAARMPVVSLSR